MSVNRHGVPYGPAFKGGHTHNQLAAFDPIRMYIFADGPFVALLSCPHFDRLGFFKERVLLL